MAKKTKKHVVRPVKLENGADVMIQLKAEGQDVSDNELTYLGILDSELSDAKDEASAPPVEVKVSTPPVAVKAPEAAPAVEAPKPAPVQEPAKLEKKK